MLYSTVMRLVGVDVGSRRIGLAQSDSTATLASPWQTIVCEGTSAEAASRVADAIEVLASDADPVVRVVVGLPKRLDGSANAQTARILEFVDALRARLAIPVDFQDERLTSREAESRLALTERDWRKRKKRLDAVAAAIILQEYLDERKKAPGAGG